MCVSHTAPLIQPYSHCQFMADAQAEESLYSYTAHVCESHYSPELATHA
jgi:hypothetical protein